jgi:hypothetical protein
MCGNIDLWIIGNFVLSENYKRFDKSFKKTESTITVGCTNCGSLMNYALSPLG